MKPRVLVTIAGAVIPAPNGGIFHYLSRAVAPFEGSWAQSTTGVERITVCP